jgi:hypothetical protein
MKKAELKSTTTRDNVPGPVPLLLAVLAHALLVSLLLLSRSVKTAKIAIVLNETKQVRLTGGEAPLVYATSPSARSTRQIPSRRVTRGIWVRPGQLGGAERPGIATLRAEAQRDTTAILSGLRDRWRYGFSPDHDYRLAARKGGDLPVISSRELPPHFEQYVTIEITIDAEGRVAAARIVAGEMPAPVAAKLLTAVRQLRYSPATRDGSAIPSLLDIVIHIPS